MTQGSQLALSHDHGAPERERALKVEPNNRFRPGVRGVTLLPGLDPAGLHIRSHVELLRATRGAR